MVVVRKAQEQDAVGVVSVHKKSWLATYPNPESGITLEKIERVFSNFDERAERWRKRIRTYDWIENGVWVAENSNIIVGFVAPAVMEGKRRVGAIYIDPEYIGRGIGGLLIEKVFTLYKGEEIYCDVASYNIHAQKFYEKHGFIFTGKESTLDFQSEGELLFTVPLKEYLKQT
ncbi:MAG: GNAT family N-acetyltransferase [Candidatus Gracilibacteria bacterium]